VPSYDVSVAENAAVAIFEVTDIAAEDLDQPNTDNSLLVFSLGGDDA